MKFLFKSGIGNKLFTSGENNPLVKGAQPIFDAYLQKILEAKQAIVQTHSLEEVDKELENEN